VSFRFRKLYADLVAGDGTVCIAYLAWLDVWGVETRFAGLELYTPDGHRKVVRARPHRHLVDGARVEIELELPDGRFVLRGRSRLGAWQPCGDHVDAALDWSVLAARTESAATLGSGRDSRFLFGVGYADWVELRRPPRALGLDLVQWGRVHLGDETVVFNAVRMRSGHTWKRAAHWSSAGLRESMDFGPPTGHRGMLSLPWQDVGSLVLGPARTLHAGNPIDSLRFPGTVERAISAWIAGPAIEERRVAQVHRDGTGPGWAVHETVQFGR
jgi:hypothetical protein